MDPNANLVEQESILAQYADERGQIRQLSPDDVERYSELRQALYDWIRDGGFEPDWTVAPMARVYYGR